MRTGFLARVFLFLGLVFLLDSSLMAQNYQSSFGPQAYDRSKAPSTFDAGILNVDSATGAVDMNLPIGPGIGARGLRYTPRVIRHFAPIVMTIPVTQGSTGKWNREFRTPDERDVLKPGELRIGVAESTTTGFMFPEGEAGSFIGSKDGSWGTNQELQGLLASFGYGVDVQVAPKRFWSQNAIFPPASLGSPWSLQTSNGGLVMGIFNPSSIPMVAVEAKGDSKGYVHAPSRYVVVKDGLAYEFAYVDAHYEKELVEHVSGEHLVPFLYWMNFRINRIANRFGDVIEFKADGSATFTGNGETQTISVTANQQSLLYKYTFDDKSLSYQMDVQGTVIPNPLMLKCLDTGEQIDFDYDEGIPVGLTAPLRLRSVTFPGRKMRFDWTRYTYRPNLRDVAWAGYVGANNNPSVGYDRTCYAEGVTLVSDTDTRANVTRTTSYIRIVPKPLWSNGYLWEDARFHVITTLPDGQKVIQFFAQPLNLDKVAGNESSTPDQQYQTLVHLKHLAKETRYLDSSVDASSDAALPASSSRAYRIIIKDRFDVRGLGIGGGDFKIRDVPSCVPYATRTRTFDRNTGVMSAEELTDWDGVNFAWKAQRKATTLTADLDVFEWRSLALQGKGYAAPGNALVSQRVDRTYSSNRAQWQFARTKTEGVVQEFDKTEGASQSNEVRLPKKSFVYDDEQGMKLSANRLVSETTEAGGSSITTSYAYKADAPTALAFELDSVDLKGSNDLKVPVGGCGVQAYSYDSSSRLTLIQPKGVNWTFRQTYDSLGRPEDQFDPNGLKTHYDWDAAGRLKGIKTDDLVGTEITPDADFLGAVLTRGAQKIHYRYNGFGELVLVRRWNRAGKATHQTIGYDSGGRKSFETVWQTGEGSDVEWTSPQEALRTKYIYDTQGRLTDVEEPTGRIIHTTYAGLLRTVTVATPGKAGFQSTAFQTDPLGRLSRVSSQIDQKTQLTRYKHDAAGRVAEVKQFDGGEGASVSQTRSWAYHSMGWLEKLVQPESGTTIYSDFDLSGRAWTSDYNGKVVRSTCDGLGRIRTVKSDDQTVDQFFEYDEAGRGASNGKQTTARSGNLSIQSRYAGLAGRLSDYNTHIGDKTFTQTFTWNAFGLRETATIQGRVMKTTFEDALELPRSVAYGGSLVATASYGGDAGFESDPSWNLRQLVYNNGGTTSFFAYGLDQRLLASMAHTYKNSSNVLQTKAWNYAYDGAHRLLGDGEDSYTYDDLGRIKTATLLNFKSPLKGMEPGKSEASTHVQSFDYDAFGNLLKLAKGGLGIDVNFTVQKNGARLLKNQLPSEIAGASYDAQGNLTQIFATPGMPGDARTMTYDALGRALTMSDAKRGVIERYQYSAEGLRTVIEEWSGATLNRRLYNIYNDARQLVSQYEENLTGSLGASRATRKQSSERVSARPISIPIIDGLPEKKPVSVLILAPASDSTVQVGQPVLFQGVVRHPGWGGALRGRWSFENEYHDSINNQLNATHVFSEPGVKFVTLSVQAPDPRLYRPGSATVIFNVVAPGLKWKRDIVYLGGKEVAEFDAKGMHVTQVDHLGSPRIVTNAQGVIESAQKYTPFGEQVYAAGSVPAKGFTNHEQTDPSGLIYMQARYYLPMYGRFGSPDPALDQHFEETQSWNINSYVQNNPVMNTDPTGMLRARFDPEARDLMDQEQLLKSLPNRYEDNPAAYKAAANEMRSVHNARGAGTGAGLAVHAAVRGGSAVLGSLSAGLVGAKERVVDFFSKAGNSISSIFSKAVTSNPIGYAPGTGKDVFTPDRLQHASRHLTDAGLLGNWSKATGQAFTEMGAKILETPQATFNHVLKGGDVVKGYVGTVSDQKVAFMVYSQGERAGKIATAIVPSAEQLAKWGVQ